MRAEFRLNRKKLGMTDGRSLPETAVVLQAPRIPCASDPGLNP